MSYSVYLSDPYGVRLAALAPLRIAYTLGVNTVCALEVTLPASFDPTLVQRDSRIEVWRSVDGGAEYLEADKLWLVRGVRRTEGASRTTVLRCVCALDLLRRRIIAYDAGTAFTVKTDSGDDLIKQFARENLTTGISAGSRDTSLYAGVSQYLTVQPDYGLGPSISVSSARDNLLDTCRKIAQACATAGTYVAFDIVWDGLALSLRTYLDQRGVDHRIAGGISPVILAPEFDNLSDVVIEESYTDEATVVIAGGQGVGTGRAIAVAVDADRAQSSPFAGAEVFAQANSSTDSTQVSDVADARLRAGRPRRSVVGRVQETPGTRYGLHWGWGDRVTVQVDGLNYDARIDAVRVEVTPEREQVAAEIRIDDD